MISFVDLMLGGTLTVALTNVNVTLTTAQARNAIVRFTGTLTGNVIITTPCLGFTIFENACTGAFTVTVQYTGGIGSTFSLVQGAMSLVAFDGTNGARGLAVGPDLTAIEALTSTGILKRTGTNAWALGAGITDLTATTANRLFGTDGSGNSGLVTLSGSVSLSGAALSVAAATQAQMESQSASAPTFPSVQKYHPGHPKAWVTFDGGAVTITGSFGVTSVASAGGSATTITYDTAFSSTAYCWAGAANFAIDGSNGTFISESSKATTTMTINLVQHGSGITASRTSCTFLGDL